MFRLMVRGNTRQTKKHPERHAHQWKRPLKVDQVAGNDTTTMIVVSNPPSQTLRSEISRRFVSDAG